MSRSCYGTLLCYIYDTLLCYRDDILQAIKRLKILGSGYTLIPVHGSYIVQCVPGEMTLDHSTVLQQAEVSIYHFTIGT